MTMNNVKVSDDHGYPKYEARINIFYSYILDNKGAKN